ncbi:MAG: bifunctional hydroxymethylpyrimidine kinase/phosphomethylpyrimidine kinase [Paramuribaculum sp.]|nr:bifunctional hydroxymethylpyrimidine kinase/phosphomethylpyrimidine kinase [Paramuribaculum sp.]
MKQYIPVLTIAGSDCSGGAGIQADIKTISAIGCYAMSAITSITAQNTQGIKSISGLSPEMVYDQLDMIWADIPPLATKTGMLLNKEIIHIVADFLKHHFARNIVIDPVMISTSGSHLLNDDAIDSMKSELFPLSRIVTPNFHEARALTGFTKPQDQAKSFRDMGCKNILLKGGDSPNNGLKIDYLLMENEDELITLTADTVITDNTHGTGCTLSSAIATYLALDFDILDAVTRAKSYITRALRAGATVKTGSGHGPVNHLFAPRHTKYLITKNHADNH